MIKKVIISFFIISLLLFGTLSITNVSQGYSENGTDGGIDYVWLDDSKKLNISPNIESPDAGHMKNYEKNDAPWLIYPIEIITFTGQIYNIGSNAFYGLENLSTISLSKYTEQIGESAFEGCTSLANISIPASVTTIGDFAFRGCTTLTSISVESENNNYSSNGGVLFNKNFSTLLACPGGLTGSYEVPEQTASIYKYAFYNCKLTSINLNKVSEIGEHGFEGCANLASLSIPTTVKTLGIYSFKGCGISGKLTIPGNIQAVPEGAFEDCEKIQSIEFSDGVKTIGKYSFRNCHGIRGTISFPVSVSTIGEEAFDQCYGMNSGTLSFEGSVKNGISIGANAFNLGSAEHSVKCRVLSDGDSGWLDTYKKDGNTIFVYGDDPGPIPPVTPGNPDNGWIVFLIIGLGFLIFILVALANRRDEDEEKKKTSKKKKANAAGISR